MTKILTITLNPAIDKSTSIKALVPEKKLKCSRPLFEPGGGGVNVARAIKKLGGDARAIYLAGGYTGNFFTELLDKEHIESTVIRIAKHTRENLIVLDNSANLQYRFGMPGPVIEEKEWKALLSEVEQQDGIDYIVASGSVPEGVPADIFARIASIARKKNARCIVDTSGEALQVAADEGVYLLKPNLGELGTLAGSEDLKIEDVGRVARQMISRGNSEVMLVSMGASGAMLVTSDEVTLITAPAVLRKSTVGAGDSMVAGMVLSLFYGKPILEAAKYAVACGTAATMNPGTELCRAEDANRLYQLVHSNAVITNGI